MGNCPICGDPAGKTFRCKVNLVYRTEYDLVECRQCGGMYFEPLPTADHLKRFYSSSYYNFDREREEGKGMAFAKRLQRIKMHGKFLDIGCATGFFINGIRKHSDWEVYGLDMSESAVRFAREKLRLDARHGEMSEVGFLDSYFDYVHLNNVLEHVVNPVSLLNECRRVIKPDGTFFLSVPNGFNDALDLIEFYISEGKPARSRNGHVFFFPARTLMMMLDRSGFVVRKMKTYSLKRGFRSIGYLPRKKNWKTGYFPTDTPEIDESSEIDIPDGPRRHSDFYYKYRFVQGNLQMIPGLFKSGLDFLFISGPKH